MLSLSFRVFSVEGKFARENLGEEDCFRGKRHGSAALTLISALLAHFAKSRETFKCLSLATATVFRVDQFNAVSILVDRSCCCCPHK